MAKTKKIYSLRHSPKKTLKFPQECESRDMDCGKKLEIAKETCDKFEISLEVTMLSNIDESGDCTFKCYCDESCTIGISYLTRIFERIFFGR